MMIVSIFQILSVIRFYLLLILDILFRIFRSSILDRKIPIGIAVLVINNSRNESLAMLDKCKYRIFT